MDRSTCDWYWSNYKSGMDWIKKHEIAYWKSQALSYRSENQRLLITLHHLYDSHTSTSFHSKAPLLKAPSVSRKHRKRKRNSSGQQNNSQDSEVEVSKELVEFLKISMKHKQEKQKEDELQNSRLSAFLPPQDVMELRQKEMHELYGDGSAKILGMETVMTLAFERFIDQKNPEYWPALPLNLGS